MESDLNMKELRRALKKHPKKRTDHDLKAIVPYAKNISLFNDSYEDADMMSDECLKIMCMQMQGQQFKAGECVFYYGDQGNLFYIIFQGEVSVLVPSNLSQQTPN